VSAPPNNVAELAKLAATWWAERFKGDEAKKPTFEAALYAIIVAELNADPIRVEVCVDYDPTSNLLHALEDAGVECRGSFSARGLLPEKTVMVLRAETLSGRCAEGYGAPWEDLYASSQRRVK
jgi:hypothetical protein